jgi:hypothetical protein
MRSDHRLGRRCGRRDVLTVEVDRVQRGHSSGGERIGVDGVERDRTLDGRELYPLALSPRT